MFELHDTLEYSPDFKKELEKADYLPEAISRKFRYDGEKEFLFSEKVCVLYCLDFKIKVYVNPENLVKVN